MREKFKNIVKRVPWFRYSANTAAVCIFILNVAGMVYLISLEQPEVIESVVVVTEPEPEPEPPADCAVDACIALTFDDGPDRDFTPVVLDILKARNAKATFFVMGRRIAGKEHLIKRAYDEGHEIGNHSWNHPWFTKISAAQRQAQIQMTQDAVVAAGVPAPQLFRPPYGAMTAKIAAEIPLTIIRWNIDPADWSASRRQHILESMASAAKPGAIVVLHDTEDVTVGNLDALITQLRAANYKLVTVSHLLGLTPGQRGTFFGR